jgi:hypothetical protein
MGGGWNCGKNCAKAGPEEPARPITRTDTAAAVRRSITPPPALASHWNQLEIAQDQGAFKT